MSHSSTSPAGASPENGPPQAPEHLAQEPDRLAQEAEERGVFAEHLLLDQLGRASFPLVLVVAMGVVRGVQNGFGSADVLVLLIGAVVSGAAMFLYALPTVLLSYGHRRQPWMPLAATGGIVAYGFGLYLVLVLGLWDQLRAPSLAGAGYGLFFLLTGFWYLRGLGRVAELAKRIDRALGSRTHPALPD